MVLWPSWLLIYTVMQIAWNTYLITGTLSLKPFHSTTLSCLPQKWIQGNIFNLAIQHKIATLGTCKTPDTVLGLRSFTESFKSCVVSYLTRLPRENQLFYWCIQQCRKLLTAITQGPVVSHAWEHHLHMIHWWLILDIQTTGAGAFMGTCRKRLAALLPQTQLSIPEVPDICGHQMISCTLNCQWPY